MICGSPENSRSLLWRNSQQKLRLASEYKVILTGVLRTLPLMPPELGEEDRLESALLTAHPDAAGALLPRMHRVPALSRTTYAPPRRLAANRRPSSWRAHRDRRCPR